MSCNSDYCSVSTPKSLNPDWMGKLANRNICEMSIPGSHDSCARVNILEWAQCQSWNFGYLLLAGIRFIDIRCHHINNSFNINHERFYCGLTFNNVLEICRDFLSHNQGECLIMRIKEEYKPADNCTRTFQETFLEYCTNNDDLISLSEDVPMLDDVRGKIWILQDFDCDSGFPWDKAMIQDEFFIGTTFDIAKKIKDMREFIDLIQSDDTGSLFINFCSGVGWGGTWPITVAQNTNKIIFDYTGKLGITVMDFPGEDLIDYIVQQNFPEDWEIIHHNKNKLGDDYVII
jgi:1-phosphatidylinositol phosphodiesterase